MKPHPFPWKSALAVVSGVVYGLSPIDLVPDLVLALGWIDDALIVPGLIAYAAITYWRARRERRQALTPARAG